MWLWGPLWKFTGGNEMLARLWAVGFWLMRNIRIQNCVRIFRGRFIIHSNFLYRNQLWLKRNDKVLWSLCKSRRIYSLDCCLPIHDYIFQRKKKQLNINHLIYRDYQFPSYFEWCPNSKYAEYVSFFLIRSLHSSWSCILPLEKCIYCYVVRRSQNANGRRHSSQYLSDFCLFWGRRCMRFINVPSENREEDAITQ